MVSWTHPEKAVSRLNSDALVTQLPSSSPIDGDFNVDCIGYAMDNKEALAKPSNFLQEVKGAINAMYGLWCKYSNYKL